jgi:branched-chain amino acid transport system ATP-binding protein
MMPVLLEIESLSKFFGGVAAIFSLSLNLIEGEILGLIGPNGAGKTTLFNLITGFLKPNEGSITFEGKRLLGLKPHKIVKLGITRTFQIPKPFSSLPCFQNLVVSMIPKMGMARRSDRLIKQKSLEIMKTTGLEEKGETLPEAFTQGDLKKLEIARALATAPKLLLLDAPFAGLTNTEIANISSVIENLHSKGITIIIVEHRLRELMRIVQRVIVLNFGEKIAEGTPEEITNNQEVIQAYLGTGG